MLFEWTKNLLDSFVSFCEIIGKSNLADYFLVEFDPSSE